MYQVYLLHKREIWVFRKVVLFFLAVDMQDIYCCKKINTWVQTLTVGQEYKQYTIQLVREMAGCLNEKYSLYVNGQELNHCMEYNPCSPLCFSGGQYSWDQDGHSFLLVYNTLSFTSAAGKYRLFIDGIDVNTNREFSSFWRRRGFQVMVLASVIILIGALWMLIFRFVVGSPDAAVFGVAIIVTGLIECIVGLAAIVKYRNPMFDRPSTVEYQSRV